jgi:Fur family peroxide stress response transcriptional regulator
MHPSAEDIYLHLKNELPIISLSSIYNILIEFEKKNIVSKLMTDSNVIRYDIIKEKHFHLYYPDGSIEDLEDKDLENLLSEYFKNKYPQIANSGDIDVIINLKNEKQPTKK